MHATGHTTIKGNLMEEKIITRPATAKDLGLVYSTFPKNVFYSAYVTITQNRHEWFLEFYQYLTELIKEAEITLACLATDPNVIVGYSIVSQDTLHFLYVKVAYRNQRIASLLMKASPYASFHVANLTKVGHAIINRKKDE